MSQRMQPITICLNRSSRRRVSSELTVWQALQFSKLCSLGGDSSITFDEFGEWTWN